MDLNVIWFFLVGGLLTGYAMLDGFDLGVGVLHPFMRNEAGRRAFLDAIGPVWDGNEVWLVVGGGTLFTAFPNAYAAAFSGFYLPFFLVLMSLIFRAVAIEFRNKEDWPWWRTFWDAAFSLGSIGSTVLFGIIIGNLIQGLPIGEDMTFKASSLATLLRPYPILVGAFVLSLFSLHGAIYLNLKTEGDLQAKMRVWVLRCFGIFLVMYLFTTIATLVTQPHMIRNFETFPWAWGIVALTILAIANVPRTTHHGKEFEAILTSAGIIGGTFLLFGIGLFPILLPSTLSPQWSLDIYNAASSPKTLWVLLITALIGIPFVLGYTLSVYWIFRGKVKVEEAAHY